MAGRTVWVMRPRTVAPAALALVAILAQGACDGAPEPAGGEPAARAAADSVVPGSAVPDGADRSWMATGTGVGPVRAGMSVAEARAALGGDLEPSEAVEGCAHAALPGAPGRVLAMILDGRVARIEVADSAVATDRGARVGDTEARIDSLYGGRVRVEPHKYTDGHYLVVVPEAPADSAYRLIFETDGQRVVEYRVGLLPAVAWVEGCS